MTTPKAPDVLELTQELVRFESITANNRETAILEPVRKLLESFGFTCSLMHYDADIPTRANLIAELNPADKRPALCLGGHIDTVPFGNAPWDDDPLSGAVKDGKIYGRGTADMKGGMAAILCAAASMAGKLDGRNLVVHIYGGEEFGLLGSRYMAEQKPETLNNIGAVIVGEPTNNRPQFGHKGVTWFELCTKGVTAHAAMPEKGDNALLKLIPAACKLQHFQPEDTHPYLGKSTLVLSVMQSGLNTNSVPDSAVLKMDCRTVAGQDMEKLTLALRELAGPDATLTVPADIPPLWSDPESTWCRSVRRIVEEVTGTEAEVLCAEFATDAAALKLGIPDVPMIVMGPGEQGMAHRTNENVRVEDLYTAQKIYEQIIADWYKL
ncbi:M20 family metallopeptidase [Desulfovibrio sp. OttesenSCG-928-C06]|nr:M20 family metallopeptidase [Desulfovibrio sp. OttesenSCG-928-C06]